MIEFKKFMDILDKPPAGTDMPNLALMLFARACLFLYWVFDNIQILSALKLLNKDPAYHGKKAMTFWFLALIADLVRAIRKYFQAKTQYGFDQSFVKKNPEKKEMFAGNLKKSKAAMNSAVLDILKALGDLMPATKGSGRLYLMQASLRRLLLSAGSVTSLPASEVLFPPLFSCTLCTSK